jgi:hypothetical protein
VTVAPFTWPEINSFRTKSEQWISRKRRYQAFIVAFDITVFSSFIDLYFRFSETVESFIFRHFFQGGIEPQTKSLFEYKYLPAVLLI